MEVNPDPPATPFYNRQQRNPNESSFILMNKPDIFQPSYSWYERTSYRYAGIFFSIMGIPAPVPLAGYLMRKFNVQRYNVQQAIILGALLSTFGLVWFAIWLCQLGNSPKCPEIRQKLKEKFITDATANGHFNADEIEHCFHDKNEVAAFLQPWIDRYSIDEFGNKVKGFFMELLPTNLQESLLRKFIDSCKEKAWEKIVYGNAAFNSVFVQLYHYLKTHPEDKDFFLQKYTEACSRTNPYPIIYTEFIYGLSTDDEISVLESIAQQRALQNRCIDAFYRHYPHLDPMSSIIVEN